MVQILYSHHTDMREFVHRRINTESFDKACEVVDKYPWAREIALFEELGEGGGFEFLLGDRRGPHAHYQFTPVEEGKGFLDVTVVAKSGLLSVLGRRALSRHFDLVTIEAAKTHIQELFEHSVEFLYRKHKLLKK